MSLPVPRTDAGRAGLAALRSGPHEALIALDYDGTLAPIVTDPARAYPAPGALAVLAGLAAAFGSLAVVTGRPAAVAVELGRFAGAPGSAGSSCWASTAPTAGTRAPVASGPRRRTRASPPRGRSFPAFQAARARAGPRLDGVAVEDKGASLAVHTRRAADPGSATEELRRSPVSRNSTG